MQGVRADTCRRCFQSTDAGRFLTGQMKYHCRSPKCRGRGTIAGESRHLRPPKCPPLDVIRSVSRRYV
jgi:hypothetical protein